MHGLLTNKYKILLNLFYQNFGGSFKTEFRSKYFELSFYRVYLNEWSARWVSQARIENTIRISLLKILNLLRIRTGLDTIVPKANAQILLHNLIIFD